MTLKHPFLLGFANSMFQSSGRLCAHSNWTDAAQNNTVPHALPALAHWETFEADLDIMRDLGVNTYRISLEWSHIEPQKGTYDARVIQRYQRLIDACLERQITPMLTLYHFNEPLWFTRLGGFEHEENIPYFTAYCCHVFFLFSAKVELWCTINEPAVQAFSGYLWGQFPPHKHHLPLTLTVLTHLFKAHIAVYFALNAINQTPMIGIVHNALCFKSRYPYDPITRSLSHHLTTITHDLFMQFFSTGILQYDLSILGLHVHYEDARAPLANDFIGLNFYANPVIGPNTTNGYGPTCHSNQEMGDMFLPLDPDGFSDAIDDTARLNKPIYITETGIADKSDRLRQKFLVQYMAVIQDKLALHVDIRGCYFWTFRDNYEWNEGHEKRLFGFYDAAGNPRASVDSLKDILQNKAQFINTSLDHVPKVDLNLK